VRHLLIILFFLFNMSSSRAQETGYRSSTTEQQLENLSEADDVETEDDSFQQQMNYFRKHPLNLNEATAPDLEELKILTALQIQQYLSYRRLLGRLLTLYELQAIPAWDVQTIQNISPFVTVKNDESIIEGLKTRWKGGEQTFLIRYGRMLEKSKGYDAPTSNSYYAGSRDKLFFRYKYNYKNLLQWGLLGDKDAGEQFFAGRQKQGFDFYSFHFFARQMGLIKALAIGDFTVNLGQGLIQWQSLAFRKNADVLAVKRQAAALRPYNSSGEYYFHRGAGITLQKGNWDATLFLSLKKISANLVSDSFFHDVVTAFQAGGYHRTPAENEDRNRLIQTAFGGRIRYEHRNGHAGFNMIYHHFSMPVQKSTDLYNLFALHGSSLTNTSVDYSYTYRNVHLFGEFAADDHLKKAILIGAVMSVDPKLDASVIYRKIDQSYQSLNGNAFTENSLPANESGLYAGITIRPGAWWQLEAYADMFRFPWLKYRVDAPTAGRDYFIQISYRPGKLVEVYTRYKNEAKQINRSNNLPTKMVDLVSKQNWRLQTTLALSGTLTVRNRIELLWYDRKGPAPEQGFLTYVEGFIKPRLKQWAGNLRLQYFETNGFNSRLYAYENDVPYSFSIPFYYEKGLRYYFNINWNTIKLFKKHRNGIAIDFWLKWSQTIYSKTNSIGSGLDEIKGNRKTEIKCQIVISR
jgi:hypothetical protein